MRLIFSSADVALWSTLHCSNSSLQVYEKAGTGPKDEDRFKLARDTQNPVAFDKRRNLGTYRTTTNMAYQAPQDVSALHCLCLMWRRQ